VTRIGLVLGAGGIPGRSFHEGVLDALREASPWRPETADHIVGTSAGSIVGAWLRAKSPRRAVDASAAEPAARRFELPTPLGVLAATARRPLSARVGVLATSVVPAGRRPHYMLGPLEHEYGATWPTHPLWLVAVRRRDGRRTVFGRAGEPETDVATAVSASCGVPGFYKPAVIAGEQYVDGGIHSPTNADLLADESLDLVIVSSPMSAAQLSIGRESAMRWMWHRYAGTEARRLRSRGAEVCLIEPTPDVLEHLALGVTDRGNGAQIRALARAATLAQLERAPDVVATLDRRAP
jgi:NTE family protein